MPDRVIHLSSKEKALSALFVLFFAFALFQQTGGGREHWPFSFFGMYKGYRSGAWIARYDLDYLAPGQPPMTLYRRANGYYFNDKLQEIGNGRRVNNVNRVVKNGGDLVLDPEVLAQMRTVMVKDVLPTADRAGFSDPQARIRLRYRFWKDFKPEHASTPSQDIVIMEPTVAELRKWAK